MCGACKRDAMEAVRAAEREALRHGHPTPVMPEATPEAPPPAADAAATAVEAAAETPAD